MLTIENLEFSYGKINALKGISLTVQDGEILSIIGANGAGKSTLMRCIAGLLKPDAGTITFDGKLLMGAPHEAVAHGVSLIPEGRMIFPNLTVEENLMLGGHLSKDRAAGIKRSYEMFSRLEERKHQRAGTLSGGEQQMLAIARGLMSNPRILLLDEPSLGLAPLLVNDVFGIIKEIHKSGMTILLVEQNARKALEIADHACVMRTGEIVRYGTGEEIRSDTSISSYYLGSMRAEK